MIHLPLTDDAATGNILKALQETAFEGIVDVELYGVLSEETDVSYRKAREILEQRIATLDAWAQD